MISIDFVVRVLGACAIAFVTLACAVLVIRRRAKSKQ